MAVAAEIKKEIDDYLQYNKLLLYLPYGHPDTLYPDGPRWQLNHVKEDWTEWSNKPWQLAFHQAGKDHQERMLMCGNRDGKTVASMHEVAIHATGLYPEWWKGRRFDHPVLVWCGSPTNETSRDIVQSKLLGGTGKSELGTGVIPQWAIHGVPKKRQCGVSDVVDQFKVQHFTDGKLDGYSTVVLKSYEQGWRKWQGTAPHIVALDEEPEDYKIYTEAQTRLLSTNGAMMVTFTPLLGVTELVDHFQSSKAQGIWLETASWDDVPHLNREAKNRLYESYPEHEREARKFGVPMMGEGRIFTENEENITTEPFVIPDHWARICGVDFGINHPAASVWLAWDRDRDVVYLYDGWKGTDKDAIGHAAIINKRGGWIPVSWPHDGLNRGKGDGKQLKDIYRENHVNMLTKSARYEKDKGGAQPVWPIIESLRQRMATDRFKVVNTNGEWFTEYRNYHQKDGKIVDRRDDLLKATFYGLMMIRYARARTASFAVPQMRSIAR